MNQETFEMISGQIARAREARKKYASMKTIGERFHIPRQDQQGVEVILYRPESSKRIGYPSYLICTEALGLVEMQYVWIVFANCWLMKQTCLL